MVVVEGAYAHVAVRTRALQRQELLDHKRNVRLALELLNDFVRVERHAPKFSNFYCWRLIMLASGTPRTLAQSLRSSALLAGCAPPPKSSGCSGRK